VEGFAVAILDFNALKWDFARPRSGKPTTDFHKHDECQLHGSYVGISGIIGFKSNERREVSHHSIPILAIVFVPPSLENITNRVVSGASGVKNKLEAVKRKECFGVLIESPLPTNFGRRQVSSSRSCRIRRKV
jgi:hypothetical protein